jgi:hypothetical protein
MGQGREFDHWPQTTVKVKKSVDVYIDSPVRLHGAVPDQLSTGITLPLRMWYSIAHLSLVGFVLLPATRADVARMW